MPIPKCETCSRDLNERPLYAANTADGVRRIGVWRCAEHLDSPPDPELQSFVSLIHRGGDG